MKGKKKIFAIVMAAVLLVVGSVMGTIAYLTSTDEVTNTFTVGDIAITLDEAKVGTDGIALTGEEAERVAANSYKLIPGLAYDKDPVIHVQKGSELAWLFVKVENGIANIEDAANAEIPTIAAQMEKNGWTAVAGATNVYAYSGAVSAADGVIDVPVFENFEISGNITNEALAAYDEAQIVVTAYAVQAEGFENAAAAWAAAFAE